MSVVSDVPTTRRCSKCGGSGPFGADSRARDGLQKRCKTCDREYHRDRYRADPERARQMIRRRRAANPELYRELGRQWRKRNPEVTKEQNLRKIGWSIAASDEAWARQNGRCAICDVAMLPGGQKANSVARDHDHRTGRRRDLICTACNVGLGHYEKKCHLFARYLEKHGS